LPATFKTLTPFSAIQATTSDGRVMPTNTSSNGLSCARQASRVARPPGESKPPNQRVASESRTLARVRAA
jgi:hypothetical protein